MRKLFSLLILFILFLPSVQAQTRLITDGKYSYEIVEGDPLQARIYKLNNGLTVFLTVNKDEPRIQTYIAVRAGSKHDPEDATGLAHYLEHMLFKGTDRYGSLDYSKEAPLIEEIIELYELHRNTTDESQRKLIYAKIDSVSNLASTFAIANEYDRMMSYIGARGTNAYTSNEQTVYMNEIPSNQIENWLTIEAERFRYPVMRLFHTELEVVYEEKNRSLDNDASKAWDAMHIGLFPNHQYGTQTTIGTIEHLKNPSIRKVIDYYNTYYVPNNMAICMSGDFDPNEVITLIDEKFGGFEPHPVPEFVAAVEQPLNSPVEFTVYGPNPEFVMFAYRLNGVNSRDADLMLMTDLILSNSTAGLIDLNLNQEQRILDGAASPRSMEDYSYLRFYGRPRDGQTLEQVKDLLKEQIEKVKSGDFPDWLPEAIVNDLKLNELRQLERNGNRAHAYVNAFTRGQKWEYYVNRINRLTEFTKEDIMNFANENFSDNYVVVYKKTGEDPDKIQIEKPAITPVEVNREVESDFAVNIKTNEPEPIEPEFVDYTTALDIFKIKNGIDVYYVKNNKNELFELYYVADIGSNNDKRLPLALSYLDYLGTSDLSPAEIKQEFYKLGCDFSVNAGQEQVYVSLSGLNENFTAAVQLFEQLLADPQPNETALANLKEDVFKTRADNKLSKNVIQNMMISYGQYGPNSPSTNILSESEINAVTSEELIGVIKDLLFYEHQIYYFGPLSESQLTETLNVYHLTPESLIPVPAPVPFPYQPTDRNKVYVVDYEMVQAEIYLLSEKGMYNKNDIPLIQLFNSYFGSGMSSIAFQELRESQALAYSVFSYISTPTDKDKERFLISYIGTQADKLPEALTGMKNLLDNMPESQGSLNSAKSGIINSIQSQRIRNSSVIFNYINAKKLGLDYDIRSDVYYSIPDYTFEDIRQFHEKNIKNSSFTMLVLGDKDRLNITELQKYGDVEFLTLEDIFGY